MAESRALLTRRERQVLDALYSARAATVAELVERVDEPVSYSAVRSALRTLREKGLVTHREDGPRYVYEPSTPPDQAARRALDHVVQTFFRGSPANAAVALLGMEEVDLPPETVERLRHEIERAGKEGR